MLNSNKMIGFVISRDWNQARKFYETVLGFRFVSQDQFALVMETNENKIRINEMKDAPPPAGHTILGWEVPDIEKVASWLKERGVTFERYAGMKQNDLGIWSAPSGDKVAWFKDLDGNLLSISEHAARQ